LPCIHLLIECLDGSYLWALGSQYLALSIPLFYWYESRKADTTGTVTIYRTALKVTLLVSFVYSFIASYMTGSVPTMLPTLEQFSSHSPTRFVARCQHHATQMIELSGRSSTRTTPTIST